MPGSVEKCPFSKGGCRNCAIFRGRHNYIVAKEGDEAPEGRVVKRTNDYGEWEDSLREALSQKVENRTPTKTKS
jgi:hypothetical protein